VMCNDSLESIFPLGWHLIVEITHTVLQMNVWFAD
jgi:hypothetical protein